MYRLRPHWDADDLPQTTLRVEELYAADPAAHAELWRYISGQDLVSTVTLRHRPVDDPLFHLVADPRRLRPRLGEGLWVRLVDLPAALRQRSYCAAADLILDVTDATCPWNAGRWRLNVDTSTAWCTPSDAPPDHPGCRTARWCLSG
ncbi:sterol carrier protein domain-containing protein [Lipingzhangella sp. LS1_29]|uniref:Sterol carrier protein domain-containing protein n=1 Tax=Lipingzhangella rawalii TaxID=2055835 RepID=A0ABU2H713_9ACTN|nr:sterol carrier protein domain-containing protein [Lipingzhangella rawalii]MDS1271096.1 sterol carrier protein domain-containing protein [Lipingzhangella rawalii]